MLTSAGPNFAAQVAYDHNNVLQNWYTDLPMQFSFKGPTSLSFGRMESFERYQGIGFRKSSSYATFASHRRVIGFNASFSLGQEINFFPAPGVLPALGSATDASAGLTIKPGRHLQMEETYLFSRLSNMFRPGVIFENHIVRSKLNYQLSRPLSFRAIVDYNNLSGNPLLANFDRTQGLNYDLLFTYFVHPGTAIYVGYSDRYENLALDPGNPLGFSRTSGVNFNNLTARQFFIKLSYAFKL